MAAPRTLYEKIVDAHTVKRIDANTVLLYCDAHFANEYTSPQAFAGLAARGRKALVPDAHLCVVDHIIPSDDVTPRVIYDEASLIQAKTLEKNCRENGIAAFYGANDPDQGVEHVLMDEQGLVRPGMVVICGDSHTTTHGALGALGFGIGTSEIEHILATQTLVYRTAGTMRVTITGELPAGSTAKDLALTVLKTISARGALGLVVEYTGSAVAALPMEGRMTLCNLTVEAGARGALIAPDEKAFTWVKEHAAPYCEEDDKAMRAYAADLHTDDGAHFDKEVTLDASAVEPMTTWGTSPDQAVPLTGTIPAPESFADIVDQTAARRGLAYQGLKVGDKIAGTPIQHVFIGSCTNARIEDLRAAAAVVQQLGRRLAPHGTQALVVPGSGLVRLQAESEGLDMIFKAAGFQWREPGCSMCLAMNADRIGAGDRCASTSNRNFEGRQGKGGRTHLVSPAMAAAAAVMGHFVDVSKLF